MWLRSFSNSLQIFLKREMFYYAVAKGRKVGIYRTWSECSAQVLGFQGATYKKFRSQFEAEQFIKNQGSGKPVSILPAGIRLGIKGQELAKRKTSTAQLQSTQPTINNVDFWPETRSESFNEDDMAENELLAVMNEVEGTAKQTQNKKSEKEYNGKTARVAKQALTVIQPAGSKRVGPFEFLIDSEGFIIVYTDGSCLRNGRPDASAGFGVYFAEGHALNVGKPVTGRATNNVGEIQAAIYAIKIALDMGITKLCINTDSQFLINSISKWVNGWKRCNWRLKNGALVKNVDEFKQLDELLDSPNLTVKWNYIKGHEGIRGNEMADKLARKGSVIYEELQKQI